MHDAALTRGHGAKAVGLARAAHLLGCNPRGQLQLVDTHGPEVLAIEPDFLVLVALQLHGFGGQEFEGAQQLASPLEQEGGIGAGKLDQDFWMLPLTILGDG